MDVVFRYKNKDGTIMAFSIQENKLYDYITNDTDGVYLDMQDDDIEKMINALRGLRRESRMREKFDIEKYIEALNNLLGSDNAYYQGDKDRDAIVELIVMAKELAEENKVLKTQLEPFKKKQCFTCLHYKVGEDHMPCYACRDYDKYEWLGGKQ